MPQKRALITGVTGQDGAYLAALLLDKDYAVYGGVRRTSARSFWRLDELGITDKLRFIDLELLEFSNVLSAIREVRPHEVYNLGAQSFVGVSFQQPIFTGNANGLSAARLLDAIRITDPAIRFYQASTSEMFGKVRSRPQNEMTPFYPRSPYAIGKLYAHWMTINYREAHNMRTSSGILFNHESPLRGPEFVTRKITLGLAGLAHGSQSPIELGNLEASRDWGHAREYVEGMWMMLQAEKLDDYVLATGQTHTVEQFVTAAASAAGFDLVWEDEGANRRATDRRSGRLIARVNAALYRPAEVDFLVGDAGKAKRELGWSSKIGFDGLVEEMVAADMNRLGRN